MWSLWAFSLYAVASAIYFGTAFPERPADPCGTIEARGWTTLPIWNKVALMAIVLSVLFSPRHPRHAKINARHLGSEIYWVILSINSLFYVAYMQFGIKSSDGEPVSSLDVLYFTLITFTTVGYGDFQPCPSVRIFAGIHGMLGIVCAALLAILLNRALSRR